MTSFFIKSGNYGSILKLVMVSSCLFFPYNPTSQDRHILISILYNRNFEIVLSWATSFKMTRIKSYGHKNLEYDFCIRTL